MIGWQPHFGHPAREDGDGNEAGEWPETSPSIHKLLDLKPGVCMNEASMMHSTQITGYDVIGDIHGQAPKLLALLRKMDYHCAAGVWRHPQRKAVFVGDFIDRGPCQRGTIDIVRPMVDSGSALAVMGNHEFNAIAWHTRGKNGRYLRSHFGKKYGASNRKQHREFLREYEGDKDLHADVIAWFLTLPLWLDIPGIRVVHACWHQVFMNWLTEGKLGAKPRLTPDLLPEAALEPRDAREKDNAVPTLFKAVEALTKGMEIPLLGGHTFTDKDGKKRDRVRVRWWDPDAITHRAGAIIEDEIRLQLPETPIPPHARIGIEGEKPTFFGHYWLTGKPALLSLKFACVDYSAGNGGPLVAYRWSKESILSNANFVLAD